MNIRGLLTMSVMLASLTMDAASQTAAVQTAAEIDALKKLGNKGRVFWISLKHTMGSNAGETKDITSITGGPLYSYAFDGSGIARPKMIVEKAWGLAISADGSKLAYSVATNNGAACDLYVANIDGSNSHKITQAPLPYIACLKGDLSKNRMVFTSRSTLSRWDRWATSNIWMADFAGAARHIIKDSRWASDDYFDYIDVNRTTVSFRHKGKYSYTMEYSETTLKDFSVARNSVDPGYESTSLGQRCASTLSPSGDSLLLNEVPHLGMELMTRDKRDGLSWKKVTHFANFPFKTSGFRWANKDSWIAMHQEEEGGKDIFAVNLKSGAKVRVTFNQGTSNDNYWGTVYLGEPSTITADKHVSAGFSAAKGTKLTAYRSMLNGRAAGTGLSTVINISKTSLGCTRILTGTGRY